MQIEVPVIIIGDGPLGLLTSHILMEDGIDSIILCSTNKENAAYLKNMSTFQSGLLQAYSYPNTSLLKNGKAGFLRSIQDSRNKLINFIGDPISVKDVEKVFNSEYGILNLGYDAADATKHMIAVRELGYNESIFGKKIDDTDFLEEKLGTLYTKDGNKEKNNYFNVPDTTMNLANLVQKLKRRVIYDSDNDSYDGKAFLYHSSEKVTYAKESATSSFSVKFESVEFITPLLILSAGFNNQKVLSEIDNSLKCNSTANGICLTCKNAEDDKLMSAHFYSKLCRNTGTYFNLCKHITYEEPVTADDKSVMSIEKQAVNSDSGIKCYNYVTNLGNVNNKIPINDQTKTYHDVITDTAIGLKIRDLIKLSHDQFIQQMNMAAIGGFDNYSFCIHLNGRLNYAPHVDFISNENIISAHSGLVTNVFNVANNIRDEIENKKLISKKMMNYKERLELHMLTEVYMKKVSESKSERTWFQ